MYIYIYIHAHILIHIDIHAYMHAYMHTYIQKKCDKRVGATQQWGEMGWGGPFVQKKVSRTRGLGFHVRVLGFRVSCQGLSPKVGTIMVLLCVLGEFLHTFGGVQVRFSPGALDLSLLEGKKEKEREKETPKSDIPSTVGHK